MKATNEPRTNSPIISTDRSPDKPSAVLKERLKLSLLIFIIYMFLTILHIGCPIKSITGISCPGCGMTRAVLSALILDFKNAFYYHPLFVLAPFLLLLFLFEKYINPTLYKLIWSVIILLFLITYIIRLFITQSDVVEIDISSGLVLKLFHNIIVGGNK